jgi:hypothetical protein
VTEISSEDIGEILAALSALAFAAFGLLDATKVFRGGIARVGLGVLRSALTPFAPVLDAAVGKDKWWHIVSANWINGVAKVTQKAATVALVKLGLHPGTAASLAAATHVDAKVLQSAAESLAQGVELSEQQMNVLGRMNAVLETLLDAAYEEAEQRFRSWSRVAAGVIAIGVSALINALMNIAPWPIALLVGVLAVPVAPLAKDLTSALSAAMRAVKAGKIL